MKLLKDAWLLTQKDLRVYVRDRSALLLGFLVPIALVTVFGWIMTYAFGGSSGMPKVTLWFVDEDGTPRSQAIVESLRSSEMINLRPKSGDKPIDATKLRSMVSDGDAHHGIIIPKGYGHGDDSEVEIKMIRDPGRNMEDRMIQIALMQSTFASGTNTAWKNPIKRLLQNRGMVPDLNGRLDSAMENMQSTIESLFPMGSNSDSTDVGAASDTGTRPSNTTSRANTANRDPMDFMTNLVALQTEDIQPPTRSKQVTYQQAQSVAGMSVMMLLFGLTAAGAILIAEREHGTLKRLFGLPIARESVLLGKFMFLFLIGLAQLMVMFVYGEMMFHVGLFRDPIALAAIVITWTATACAFGMFIATFSKSAKQADGLATILILTMAALGGCWFPLQMMTLPLPMDIATKSTMTYWAMEGMQGMLWNNLGLSDKKILFALGVQWFWAIGLSTLSVYYFRKNYCAG